MLILGLLEVSVSFDNAIVNASILKRMNPFWQRMFLTVGIVIAVFGVRLILPLLIVALSAGIGPIEVVQKAFAGGSAAQAGTYGYLLEQAHPVISAFGGTFLLMLVLDFFFADRDIRWLGWIEAPLARIGKLRYLSIVVATAVLIITAVSEGRTTSHVLLGGAAGIGLYVLVKGLGRLLKGVAGSSTKAGLFLFFYLQVLDASFSLDGVIGAFAISNDIILIAIGLGIGAVFIRSLTIMMVHRGTLGKFRFLEHGAHWAIAALAFFMLIGINVTVPGIVTGLTSTALITGALVHSILVNKREKP